MRVFLTGASSGIGEALARHYAAAGATLGLAARRQGRLADLAAALQAAATDFIGRHGCPDIVIANAGVSVGTLAAEAGDLPALRRVFETDVMGMAQTLQPFIAAMKARGSGRLVGIASVAGIRGLPGAGAYSASKAATFAWLEALRVELHGSGVKVVTLVPGYIATPMTAVNRYPMPFLLAADEAAPRFARAIEGGTSYTVIPWQMGVAAKLLRLLPNPLFDAIFARAGRKPRGLDL